MFDDTTRLLDEMLYGIEDVLSWFTVAEMREAAEAATKRSTYPSWVPAMVEEFICAKNLDRVTVES